MTNKNSRRSHDAFFRWLFADENHLRALLKLSAKSNLEIQQFLAAVDPNTFVRIPDSYSNVDETGEADLAFRVNAISGDHALVGVLLEHKSGPDANTLAQMGKYVNSVMNAYAQSHSATQIPTVAILFYNGKEEWNPYKNFPQYPEYFHDVILPFKAAFVNMTQISDDDCLKCENLETAMGVTAMKYAFDSKKLREALLQFKGRFQKLPPAEAKNLLEKISLYLKEFLDDKVLEELNVAFVSIGQKYGFVSAGDVFRQRQAEALAEGISKGRKEGLSKGLSKGRKEGLSLGLSKGRAEGIRQNTRSLAKGFLKKGVSVETIAEVTGLTIDEIKAL